MSRRSKAKEIIGNSFLMSDIFPNSFRILVLKMLGVNIGRNFVVKKFNHIDGFNISIGDNSLINRGAFIHTNGSDEAKILIGSQVQIAPNVCFLCTTHKMGLENRRASTIEWGGITVEDGVWIGANVTILPNVIISKGCVIAAGSVVTKNTEPNGLYAGVPAVRKKDL